MRPLVSVIIPTFNEEQNIERLLVSLKNQNYNRIEMIVVDDGSKDKTVEIAKKYTSKVYKRQHAERSVQRNFGAKISKGELLLFLDADMELSSKVIQESVNLMQKNKYMALIIPERTVGKGTLNRIRKFEREMYEGEPQIELARLFERNVFFEFGGYDPQLTGPEDYDLPYRISKKYKVGRASEFILHHEEGIGLGRLLNKKYYYASHGAVYAKKHPELVRIQGTILFRKIYIKNWKKFIKEPILGIEFIIVRFLETVWAIAGYISEVGIFGFVQTFFRMLRN